MGATRPKAKKQLRGSLHCAAHGKTMSSFGRADALGGRRKRGLLRTNVRGLHLGAEGLQWFGVGLYCGVGVDHVLFQELVVEAVEGEFEAVGDAELVVDLAQAVVDDPLGGAGLVSDFLVAPASCDGADGWERLFRELALV